MRKKLGDILLTLGIINDNQLSTALAEQKKVKGKKLGDTLIDLGYTNELEIANALRQQLDIELVKLSNYRIQDNILKLITDQNILRKYVLIPFELHKDNPNILRIAMADPMDLIAIDDISILTNMQIEPVIATQRDILAAIDEYYGKAEAQAVAAKYSKEKEQQYQAEEEIAAAYNVDINSSPIVILVRSIIEQAVRKRASDIHIEALESVVRVRYRVDGILYEAMTYQIELLPAIIARIKIISELDISEKRKPQDGRITMVVDRTEVDIRVSILPTVYGEKVVMRLTLNKDLRRNKRELGLYEKQLKVFNELLSKPYGMILVTGPTGSGKSTTLYTALSELNRDEVNIITVEDPVEANINGVNQVQMNTKVDLTFANALRSILRQDPDIIMIGEIRDTETAGIAIKASITGHLVLSTLHTNSAASTITRLVDMGVEPYLIADAVVGVIAQRLLRKLCTCKTPHPATRFEKELIGADLEEELILYEPNGCNQCNGTGYFGRIGIYEIMPVTMALKNIISKSGTSDQIKAAALKEGMETLRENAIQIVRSGITSFEEMIRITYEN